MEFGLVSRTIHQIDEQVPVADLHTLTKIYRRFLDRFARVESALGGDLQGRSIGELDVYWRQAKAQIKAEADQA